MILTVTLNAAMDRTLTVPSFGLAHRHRASASLALPGGKGVNVARALKRLEEPVIATGLAGGRTGTTIIEELTAEGILNDFVHIREESRTSTAVIDPMVGGQTEINEQGPSVGEDELSLLLDKLHYLSKGADLVVLAGSLPPDVPEDFYATMLRHLREAKVVTAVDASGPPLRAALPAEPGIVSPNAREAEEIVGYEFQDDSDLAAGAEALERMGAGIALVHVPDGCIARFGGGRSAKTLRARLEPQIDGVSTVGSGDAFLAGFVATWYLRKEPEEALRRAVACGAANTRKLGAGMLDLADVEAFARQVDVIQVG